MMSFMMKLVGRTHVHATEHVRRNGSHLWCRNSMLLYYVICCVLDICECLDLINSPFINVCMLCGVSLIICASVLLRSFPVVQWFPASCGWIWWQLTDTFLVSEDEWKLGDSHNVHVTTLVWRVILFCKPPAGGNFKSCTHLPSCSGNYGPPRP